jgi:Fic family protein
MRIVSRLKYIKHFRDRHGKQRYYFHRAGQPNIALPGTPGDPEFIAAYHAISTGGLRAASDTTPEERARRKAQNVIAAIKAAAELAGYEVARIVNGREGKIVVELTPTRE